MICGMRTTEDEKDLDLRALEVVKALDGLPINVALNVLDQKAKAFLCGTHVVDVKSERFTALADDVREGRPYLV